MSDRVIATVDLAAIRHNLQQVRRFAPGSKVMAAVKADAYGHGAVPVARTLEAAGVDALAVACIEEALELREAHVRAPIALLEGILSAEEATLAAYERLQIVLNDFWQIELLESMPASASLQVWFKLDSGMHRLGFPLSAVPKLQAVLERNRGWQFCGWITHLACADEPDSPMTLEQIGAFDEALAPHWRPLDRQFRRPAGLAAGATRMGEARPGAIWRQPAAGQSRTAAWPEAGADPDQPPDRAPRICRRQQHRLWQRLCLRAGDARRCCGSGLCGRDPSQPRQRRAGADCGGQSRGARGPRIDGHDHARSATGAGRRCRR
jgi:hypothetical protein